MEEPPLIDVEPEDDARTGNSGCGGCLIRLMPVLAGLLLLSIIFMGVVYFIWGQGGEDSADLSDQSEDGLESVEAEKTGLAGFVEKVKQVVKGEKPTAGTSEAPGQGGSAQNQGPAGSEELPESIDGVARTPEERNQLVKEKFGHLEEDRPQGTAGSEGALANPSGGAGGAGEAGGVAMGGDSGISKLDSSKEGASPTTQRKRRGGSFGSSTGSAVAGGANESYQIWRSDFSTSGSDLEFEVIYKQAGNQIQFRCFVMPYDSQTAKMFRADKGELLLSFHSREGKKLVPAEGVLPIPLTKMTAFESKGEVMGWVARGMTPLDGAEISAIDSVKLAWDFDKDLGDWLKDLKKSRSK